MGTQDRAEFQQMGTSSLRRISTGPLIAIIALIWYGVFYSKVIFAKFATLSLMTDAGKMLSPSALLLLLVWSRPLSLIVGQMLYILKENFVMSVENDLMIPLHFAVKFVRTQ